MRIRHSQGGFTIVELLIAIVVVGLLANLVINTFGDIQTRARNSTASQALRDIEQAILRLAVDTGKWPNGCPPDQVNDPEADIESVNAGLTQVPTAGVISAPCQWEFSEVDNWFGPYVSDDEILDPWGNSFEFDPDFYAYANCSSITTEPVQAAIVSYGPDGSRYTCDDVYRILTD